MCLVIISKPLPIPRSVNSFGDSDLRIHPDREQLAIQEPWRSTHKNTAHRFRGSGFDLAEFVSLSIDGMRTSLPRRDTYLCMEHDLKTKRRRYPDPQCLYPKLILPVNENRWDSLNPEAAAANQSTATDVEQDWQQMPGQHIGIGDFDLLLINISTSSLLVTSCLLSFSVPGAISVISSRSVSSWGGKTSCWSVLRESLAFSSLGWASSPSQILVSHFHRSSDRNFPSPA
jgi:hypothetical protein